MPVTTLDPKTALIVVDLQKGITSVPAAHPAAGVVANAAALADAFRSHHLPVVLVNVGGGAPGRTEMPPRGGERPADWMELVPELKQQPGDILVTKKSWGAFTNTGLADRLKALGVTHVVIAGIATTIGVESTARQAFELGLNVTLAVDAMTDPNADAHANAVARIFPRMAETGTTAEIVALLK
jgi:nicotinamidase-related amidase